MELWEEITNLLIVRLHVHCISVLNTFKNNSLNKALVDMAPKYILDQFMEAELMVNITEHEVNNCFVVFLFIHLLTCLFIVSMTCLVTQEIILLFFLKKLYTYTLATEL